MKLFLSESTYVRSYINKTFGVFTEKDSQVKPMRFAALTLTLSPDHWRKIFKSELHQAMCYFTYLIKELGYDSDHSFGIIEWTKQSVPHCHAIVRLGSNDLEGELYTITTRYKKVGKRFVREQQYKDNRIDVEHYLDPIYSGNHLKAVIRYITKTLPPLTILNFLQEYHKGVSDSLDPVG